MNKWISYSSIALLVLSLGAALNRTMQLQTELSQKVEELSTYETTTRELSSEVKRLTVELDQTTQKEQDVVETITERKDGTKTTKRTIKSKEQVVTKEVVTKEDKRETDKTSVVKGTSSLRTETVEVTKPVDSGKRLGIGLGVATRVGLDWSVGVTPYVSYETKYKLAPSIGVEFNPTFSVPRAVLVGVEFRF